MSWHSDGEAVSRPYMLLYTPESDPLLVGKALFRLCFTSVHEYTAAFKELA